MYRPNLYRVAGIARFDAYLAQPFLGVGVLRSGDIDGVLVPTGDFNRAVEIVERQAAPRGLRIAVMKVLVVAGFIRQAKARQGKGGQGHHRKQPFHRFTSSWDGRSMDGNVRRSSWSVPGGSNQQKYLKMFMFYGNRTMLGE